MLAPRHCHRELYAKHSVKLFFTWKDDFNEVLRGQAPVCDSLSQQLRYDPDFSFVFLSSLLKCGCDKRVDA